MKLRCLLLYQGRDLGLVKIMIVTRLPVLIHPPVYSAVLSLNGYHQLCNEVTTLNSLWI